MVQIPIWAMVGLLLLVVCLFLAAAIASGGWWYSSYRLAELESEIEDEAHYGS